MARSLLLRPGDGMATWRSGYVADCKSAHPGSIPGVASTQLSDFVGAPPGAGSAGLAGASIPDTSDYDLSEPRAAGVGACKRRGRHIARRGGVDAAIGAGLESLLG